MYALRKRHTPFYSALDSKKDITLKISGVSVIVELNHHSIKKKHARTVYEATVIHMVKKGFRQFEPLQTDERFYLISKELGISVLCAKYPEDNEVVVSIISVLNGTNPTNPYRTLEIFI